MKKSLRSAVVAFSLVATIAVASPAIAGVSPHAARTSCATMGMTPASLRPYFGTVAVAAAGYECGLTGDDLSTTLYLFPSSERAAVMKAYPIAHARRAGGLGAYAIFANEGSGEYRMFLTRGAHTVYFYAELLPSTPKLIALAHVVYRALG
jgi:hypothetical protein